MGDLLDILKRTVLGLLGGLPPLCLSVALIMVWIDPMSIDEGGWVRVAATLVMIEFLLLHSGAFMAAGPMAFPKFNHRLLWFVGFGLVYSVSILAYAHWSGGKWVAWFLAGLLLSRFLTLVILDDKRGTIMIMQRSVIGIIIFMLTLVVVFLPLPELGIDETVRRRVFGGGVDLLATHPERSIAWGATYFLLMAIIEFFVGWNIPDQTDEVIEETWRKSSSKQQVFPEK